MDSPSPPLDPMVAPSVRGASTRFGGALACAVIAIAAAALAQPWLARSDLAMLLLLGVLTAGAAFGLRPALLSSAVSAFAYNLLFLEPRFTLAIARPADLLTFGVFFAAAIATGWLGGRARDGERAAADREADTRRLLDFNQSLAATTQAADVARVLVDRAAAVTGGACAVLLPLDHAMAIAASRPPLDELEPISAFAAKWTADRGEASGAGTDVQSDAEWALLPLRGSQRCEGVLALRRPPEPAARRLLGGLCDAGGPAIERARLATTEAENEALRRTDRLRAALLSSMSHDLRTPLAGILGSATTLIDYGAALEPAVAADMLQGLREEAERLERYIGDLLDLSRLEGGALTLRLEWTDLRDVVAAAAGRTAARSGGRPPLHREAPAEPALARVDAVLLEQALMNVLDNAALHAAGDRPVRLLLRGDEAAWIITVEDDGPGLPAGALDSVFTPFVRLNGDVAGSGLGLSIARGFSEAMGGTLRAESPIANGRGARFVFRFRREEPAA